MLLETKSLHDMQKKHRSTTVLEEISRDLHYHIPRLAWLIRECLVLVKKKSGLTLKEAGHFVTSLTHLVLFIQIQRSS